MNDVLKDERRILCDVLDQWEVRWSWTGDAEDESDAGMRSRDETQPIMAGGCCEGCWGGPGPVMPANQRGAAHIWCGAVTLTHVRTGGEMWGMMTGPMILEKMLWQALSCFFFLELVLWVIFIFTKTSHVVCQGFWHQPMRCYNIPTQPGGRLWPYVASWHHPMMAGCGNILCRIQPRTRRGGEHVYMYLSLTFLLWPISSHV